MARSKRAPVRREPSSEYFDRDTAEWRDSKDAASQLDGSGKRPAVVTTPVAAAGLGREGKAEAGVAQLLMAVCGIYASFLTWAYLQEKLTTTPHGPVSSPTYFRFPVFLNTIQSTFAAMTGFVYLYLSTSRGARLPPLVKSRDMLGPLLVVSLTSSLASPFGYASLAHIDYVTFLLAKSCKLLPFMALNVTVFRRSYPWHKYLVVAAVTAGVAVFTLHSGKAAKKHKVVDEDRRATWGLLLLGVNLLFDGLTGTTQDHIVKTFAPYSGAQMMCANNLMSTLVTGSYLVLSPWLVHTGIGEYLGMDVVGSTGELRAAMDFMVRHPAVWQDVLGFAACGAIGQIFIFYTLSTFSSVLLVTVNVTRKMFTMIISVVAFGHRLSHTQWLGVGLVFGGIGLEAEMARREKTAREKEKKRTKEMKGQ